MKSCILWKSLLILWSIVKCCWCCNLLSDDARLLAANSRGNMLTMDMPEWKRNVLGGSKASFGKKEKKSILEQRQSLPIYRLKDELVKVFYCLVLSIKRICSIHITSCLNASILMKFGLSIIVWNRKTFYVFIFNCGTVTLTFCVWQWYFSSVFYLLFLFLFYSMWLISVSILFQSF